LNRKKNQISDFSNFYFSSYAEKQCGRQFWNAVEREPVETRVLNTTASKARCTTSRNNVATEKCSISFLLKIFQNFNFFFMEDRKSAE